MFIKWNVHLIVLSKVFLFLILSYCFSLLHTMSYKEDICLQLSFERGPWGQFHLKGMKSSSKFAGHSFHRDCISASGWSLMLLQWCWAPEAQEHPHNIELVAFIKVWRTVCKTMHFCKPRKWTPGLQVLFPSEKKNHSVFTILKSMHMRDLPKVHRNACHKKIGWFQNFLRQNQFMCSFRFVHFKVYFY